MFQELFVRVGQGFWAKAWAYVRLMRLHRPVGIYLLLVPVYLALWLAGEGSPNPWHVVIFTLGVVLTRSAGCVINDYFDRDFDANVARTQDRPLATREVSPKEALGLFVLLALFSAQLLWFLPLSVMGLALLALALMMTYPLMKRMHFLPQAHLGLAFAWAVPMVFVAETGSVSTVGWVLFATTLLWVLAYDTFYALADRADDEKIGVKSSARLFGRWVFVWLFALYVLVVLGFWALGILAERSLWFWLGLLGFVLWIPVFFWLARQGRFIAAFTLNHWAGWSLVLGTALDYLL